MWAYFVFNWSIFACSMFKKKVLGDKHGIFIVGIYPLTTLCRKKISNAAMSSTRVGWGTKELYSLKLELN